MHAGSPASSRPPPPPASLRRRHQGPPGGLPSPKSQIRKSQKVYGSQIATPQIAKSVWSAKRKSANRKNYIGRKSANCLICGSPQNLRVCDLRNMFADRPPLLFAYLHCSICLPIFLPVCLPDCLLRLPVYLPVCLPVCVCLFDSLPS